MPDNTDTSTDAVLRIDQTDADLINEIMGMTELNADRLEGAGSDGGGALITLILTLSTTSLPFLVSLLKARWARAQHVKIEVDGVKVEGANPEDIERILTRVIDARSKGEKADDGHSEKP